MGHIPEFTSAVTYLRALDFNDLFTSIMAAIEAYVMGAMFLAAIGAVDQMLGLNSVVRTAAVTASLRYLSLW
jgi:hypothetical protein